MPSSRSSSSSLSSSSSKTKGKTSSSNFSGAKKTTGGGKGKAERKKMRTKTTAGNGVLGGTNSPVHVYAVVPRDNAINPHHISNPNKMLDWPKTMFPLKFFEHHEKEKEKEKEKHKEKEKELYAYAAALVLLDKVLLTTQATKSGSLHADVDEKNDSVDLLEKQIGCLLAAFPSTRSPLRYVLPLYKDFMGLDLRTYFYTSEPFPWKYYRDNKQPYDSYDNSHRHMKQRADYKNILIQLYLRLFQAMQKTLPNENVLNVERQLISAAPVALCEAKILNLAARLQLEEKKFIDIPREWTTEAQPLHMMIHPAIKQILGTYIYIP